VKTRFCTYLYELFGWGNTPKILKKRNVSSNLQQNKSSGKAHEYWISSKIGAIKWTVVDATLNSIF